MSEIKKSEKYLITKTLTIHKQFILENKKLDIFMKSVEKYDEQSKILMIQYILGYKKVLKKYNEQLSLMNSFSSTTKKYIPLLKNDLKKNNVSNDWVNLIK